MGGFVEIPFGKGRNNVRDFACDSLLRRALFLQPLAFSGLQLGPPGLFGGGRMVNDLAHFTDWFPTLLALTGPCTGHQARGNACCTRQATLRRAKLHN